MQKHTYVVLAVAASALVLSAPGLVHADAPEPTYSVQETSNVQYGPLSDEVLDLYLPAGKTGASTAIVFIHGGAWTSGSKTEHSDIINWLASRGYVVASINYRLVQGEIEEVPPNPDETNIWPDQIVDAQLAVRWLRSNATAYHVNKNRICAMGQSAGGQLALMLGMLSVNYPGDESAVLGNISPLANCVVDNSGPTDLDIMINGQIPYEIAGLLDSTASSSLDSASPIHYVTSTTSPIAITDGVKDPHRPPGQPQNLIDVLNADSVPNTLISYNGAHVFTGLTWKQTVGVLTKALQFIHAQF